MFQSLPNSVLQMGMIFLSIVIEALPFVLLGCLISGTLHVFLTPERVRRFLPKNKFASVVVGCVMGVFFPSCECGIVPIVNQFVKKGVPTHTAFAFMLTAPIVNPIVIFSTYIAFGDTWRYAALRVLGAVIVALVVGNWLAYFNKKSILKSAPQNDLVTIPEQGELADVTLMATEDIQAEPLLAESTADVTVTATCSVTHAHHGGFLHQIEHVLRHSLDEFFDTGRYLMIGALIASGMQTFLPTATLLTLGSSKLLAILVMLVLALVMSLCSEADAFIGSSLLSLFGTAPVVAFLVFGPMVDIKNLLMMKRYFNGKFILKLVGLILIVVTGYALVV
ncbi:permease [Enterococcus diestrammenae]|uniref:Permease n=1 Tax=Enterococcus diestrammenae TaxID=1155073 RepID=A0ABV0F813_9ENTE|nr:permease [Enterococcus diestrammenae]KAF1296990.1 hypothetical protein BAU18_00160 [Enterococcus diestrammenae]